MLISDKQQKANRQNAQHSTGPSTSEGKAAVRLNALTYGLRARDLILPWEDPEEYKQLWAALVAEWQPQTPTERLHLEQMATSQWLLARMAKQERRICECGRPIEEELPLLDRVSALRTRLERSCTSAMRELKQLQKERQAQRQHQQTTQPKQTGPAAQPAAPHPAYAMSESTDHHPAFCAPVTPDTR